MPLIAAITAALMLWVTLWGLGAKAFDAMLLILGIISLLVVVHLARPYLPGSRR